TGCDPHRRRPGGLPGRLLVQLEQVAVAVGDRLATETGDGVGEVQVHAVAQRPDATAGVELLLGGAARDVAGRQVPVGRVLALEVVVAFVLGDCGRVPVVAGAHR